MKSHPPILARGCGSTDQLLQGPYKNEQGLIFLSTGQEKLG